MHEHHIFPRRRRSWTFDFARWTVCSVRNWMLQESGGCLHHLDLE